MAHSGWSAQYHQSSAAATCAAVSIALRPPREGQSYQRKRHGSPTMIHAANKTFPTALSPAFKAWAQEHRNALAAALASDLHLHPADKASVLQALISSPEFVARAWGAAHMQLVRMHAPADLQQEAESFISELRVQRGGHFFTAEQKGQLAELAKPMAAAVSDEAVARLVADAIADAKIDKELGRRLSLAATPALASSSASGRDQAIEPLSIQGCGALGLIGLSIGGVGGGALGCLLGAIFF